MGLDMYLRKRHRAETNLPAMLIYTDLFGNARTEEYLPMEDDPIVTMETTVIYWRKANQIHRWFVEEAQYGDDDCLVHSVLPETLEELLEICKEIDANTTLVPGQVIDSCTYRAGKPMECTYRDGLVMDEKGARLAQRILPTKSGFFFGSIDYDEDYLLQVRHTIKELTKVLEADDPSTDEYYYTSSW